MVRRLPLTTGLTAAVLLLGAVSHALWSPLADRPLADRVGYGPHPWHAGHWWGPFTGAFFADRPLAYVPLLLGLVLVGGLAEWRLGTLRTLVAGVVSHLVAAAGAAALVVVGEGRGLAWAAGRATRTDVGTAAAVLGAAAAATASMSPRWRRRVRVVLVGYAATALVLGGGVADLERLLAVLTGLLVGLVVAGAPDAPGQPAVPAAEATVPPTSTPVATVATVAALVGVDERTAARRRLRACGSANRLAWMTTWSANHWFRGTAPGYLAYREHLGVALGLCDPVAPGDEGRATVLREYASSAHRRGLVPCVFAATAETAADAVAAGWRVLPIGEEAVVDLPGLRFQGRAWQDVRTALNHAARRGITVELSSLAALPAELREQVRVVASAPTGSGRLPQLGFTLGGLAEATDPEVRVAVAVDVERRVLGVVSWLPTYAPGPGPLVGWTLDVMRRAEVTPPAAEGPFRPVMELLIATSLQRFRDEGARWASLSASPLARVTPQVDAPPPSPAVDRVLREASARLEPYYGFRSLHAFKAKFSPRFEPLYLIYPDDLALPRILGAVLRAYLPHLGWRGLAAIAVPRPHEGAQARTPATALSAAAAPSGSSTVT